MVITCNIWSDLNYKTRKFVVRVSCRALREFFTKIMEETAILPSRHLNLKITTFT